MGIKINWIHIIIMVSILGAGFFLGRYTTEPKTEVKYVKGKTVTDTIYSERLVPYKVEIPVHPDLPLKPDTSKKDPVHTEIKFVVDTAKIIANYIVRNSYKQTLFDSDTVGRLDVEAVVQYNKMQKLGWNYTPIHKEVIKIQKRVFVPFVSGSYNSFGYVGAGGGFFYHDLGISAKYLTNFQNKGWEVGAHFKF